MKGFKLYFIYNGQEILLTEFVQENRNNAMYMTFQETLVQEEHDKWTLTFSVSENDINKGFPSNFKISNFLRIGRKLKLVLDDEMTKTEPKYKLLIISSLSPEGSPQNIIWNITAQDYISYVWSKNLVGFNFNSMEDAYFLENYKTSTIANLTEYILIRGGLFKKTLVGGLSNIYDNSTFNSDYYTTNISFDWGLHSDWQYYKIEINNNKDGTGWNIYEEQTTSNFIVYNWNYDGDEKEVLLAKTLSGFTLSIHSPDSALIEDFIENIKVFVYLGEISELEEGWRFNRSILSGDFSYPGDINISLEWNEGWYIDNNNYIILYNFGDPNISRIVYKMTNDDYLALIGTFQPIDTLSCQKFVGYNPIVNIDISNSNTYNALIELANLTGSILEFDYNNKFIYFHKKDANNFRKNYYLSPNVNLQDFSLDYNGDEFSSILHATGGEDEYGVVVSMIPYIPDSTVSFFEENEPDDFTFLDIQSGKKYYSNLWNDTNWKTMYASESDLDDTERFIEIADRLPYLDSFLLNIGYFLEQNIINQTQYEEILLKFYNDLRKINMKFQNISNKKLKLEYYINQIENKILNNAEILGASVTDDYESYNRELKELFYGEGGGTGTNVVLESDSLIYPNLPVPSGPNKFLRNVRMGLPDRIWVEPLDDSLVGYLSKIEVPINTGENYFGNYKISLTWNGAIWSSPNVMNNYNVSMRKLSEITSYSWQPYLGTDFDGVYYSNDIEPLAIYLPQASESLYANNTKYKVIGTTGLSQIYICSQFIRKIWTPWGARIEYRNANETEKSLVLFRYEEVEEYSLIKQYPFFEKLRAYGGWEEINKKYNYYLDLIKSYIDERIESLNSLNILKDKISLSQEDESRIAWLEEYIKDLEKAVGKLTYSINDNGVFINDSSGIYGKFGYIWYYFNMYMQDFYDQAVWEGFITIKQMFNDIQKQKNDFWYNLKNNEDYGHIFIENYYENETEINSLSLYNEAMIYYLDYKQPSENFSISYLDISQIIGQNIDLIKVGDIVKISSDSLGISFPLRNELQVYSITRDLRDFANIQLSVNRTRYTDKILEKIMLGIK